jgi:CRP/FNR family transcriptional regulator, dissimilatory nitrate respiration regulator
MYFVVSGEVHLVRHSSAGHHPVLQRGRSGFLAEASLDRSAYHCDAVAIAESEVLILPRHAFQASLANEQFRTKWITHLARELRRVRAHAERLSLKTARDRVVHFIETEGDDGVIKLSQSKKDWAAEPSLTHEALYRLLARMQAEGRIEIVDAVITLRS